MARTGPELTVAQTGPRLGILPPRPLRAKISGVCVPHSVLTFEKNIYTGERVNLVAEGPGSLSLEVSSTLSLVSDRGHSGDLLSPSAGGTRTFATQSIGPGFLGQPEPQLPAARAVSAPQE